MEGGTPDGYAEVRVTGHAAIKSEFVDDLAKLESVVRRVGSRADLTVGVVMRHRHSISVFHGDGLLGELGDQDEDKSDRRTFFDAIEDMIDDFESGHRGTPSMFDLSVLGKLNKLKPGAKMGFADIAQHKTLDLVGVRVGPTFNALVAGINREGFKNGGPWGDGPGTPGHLF